MFDEAKAGIDDRTQPWRTRFLNEMLLFSKFSYKLQHVTFLDNIHNWSLQPLSQDYGLASHTTHVVCVNFIRGWLDLQFNVDSERQIFEKFCHGRFIYSHKSAERMSPKKYFWYFIFYDWPGIRTQAFESDKPTHYLLEQGVFMPSEGIWNYFSIKVFGLETIKVCRFLWILWWMNSVH